MRKFHLHTPKMLQGDFQLLKINVAFVFQVNCPGCFIYGIPLLNELFKKYEKEIGFISISTAFEDFELNTEANTIELLNKGELVGETRRYFGSANEEIFVEKILFPVAFDVLTPAEKFLTDENITTLCKKNLNFDLLSSEERQTMLISVRKHYRSYPFIAETFTLNQLSGTPSFVIFDNHYNILQSLFGHQDKDLIELFLQHYLTSIKI